MKPELCIFAWFYGLIWCSYFTEHRYSFCIYILWHPFSFSGGRSKNSERNLQIRRNLLGLSSKILYLIVNQRAAGETATQAVNNACHGLCARRRRRRHDRHCAAAATSVDSTAVDSTSIDAALPLPPSQRRRRHRHAAQTCSSSRRRLLQCSANNARTRARTRARCV